MVASPSPGVPTSIHSSHGMLRMPIVTLPARQPRSHTRTGGRTHKYSPHLNGRYGMGGTSASAARHGATAGYSNATAVHSVHAGGQRRRGETRGDLPPGSRSRGGGFSDGAAQRRAPRPRARARRPAAHSTAARASQKAADIIAERNETLQLRMPRVEGVGLMRGGDVLALHRPLRALTKRERS